MYTLTHVYTLFFEFDSDLIIYHARITYVCAIVRTSQRKLSPL